MSHLQFTCKQIHAFYLTVDARVLHNIIYLYTFMLFSFMQILLFLSYEGKMEKSWFLFHKEAEIEFVSEYSTNVLIACLLKGWKTASSSSPEGHVHLGALGQNRHSGVWGKTLQWDLACLVSVLSEGVVVKLLHVSTYSEWLGVLSVAYFPCIAANPITLPQKVILAFCMNRTWWCCFLFPFS